MTKKKTLRLRRNSRLRKTGGAINCRAPEVGFTDDIVAATFGAAYRNAIVSHLDSEQWTYERLVDISTRGMVRWYCEKVNLTPEQCTIITSMPEVQILGAFFHRYKVFCEHIRNAKTKLTKEKLFGSSNMGSFFLKMSKISKLKNTREFNAADKSFTWMCILSPRDFSFEESANEESMRKESEKQESMHTDFNRAIALIEKTIDDVQCLLWVIVNNKGLPQGFIMDARIKKLAETPIILGPGNFPETIGYLSPIRTIQAVTQIGNLIEAVFTHKDILIKPPVTFGVLKI